MSKQNDPDKKIIDDAIAHKIIYIISLVAFAALGIWMILDPEGGEHSSYEKGSVYVMKEIWSLEAGVIILMLTFPFIALGILKVIGMKKHTWYKDSTGYYLYINKLRSSGNQSMYEGKDLLIFHPESQTVYKLKNYEKAKPGKFYTASPYNKLDVNKAYWTATNDGYYLFYKGKRVENITSKYEGDDLYIKSPEIRKNFKLTNYKNSLDNKIREAEVLN